MGKRETAVPKKKGGWKKVLLIILSAVIVLGGAGYLVVDHYLDKINREDPSPLVDPKNEDFEVDDPADDPIPVDDPVDDPIDEPEPPKEIVVEWEPITPIDDSKLLNILFVGDDRRPGEGRQRSDAMILCSINTNTGKVSLVSFQRDTYVQIPGGYTDNRLNAAYAFGGFNLLKKTLRENFGISIDGCFAVNFEGFQSVIDTVGGVNITLSAAEVKELNGQGFAVVEGENILNGTTALAYARIRHIDTDWARTSRQRNVIMTVFNKIKGLSVGELIDLANVILPMLMTDMSNGDILALIPQMASLMGSMSVSSYSVPNEGEYTQETIRGMWVVVPNRSKIVERLKNKILPF